MAKFICERCNYRFVSELKETNKKCPYCGKEGVVKEPDAESLLSDL